MIKTVTYNFTADDVTTSGSLYYYQITHNLNTTNYLVSVINNSNEIVNTSNLYAVGTNTLKIYLPNDTISGTWHVSMYYDDGRNSFTTKKLFEQELVTADELPKYSNYRFAFSLPDNATKTVTVSGLKSFVQASLDSSLYLVCNNNLSDVTDIATARNNLNVYSKNEVDSFISSFYSLNGYISNISAFTPSTGLTTPPTVNINRNFNGFELNLTGTFTSTEANTNTGLEIGSFDITPTDSHTVTFDSVLYFPLFCWSGDNYEISQIQAKFSTIQNSVVRCTLKVWIPRPTSFGSGDATVKTTINCNIISHT